MDSVHQKMHRARAHCIELREKLVQYYSAIPGTFEEGPGCTPEVPDVVFRESKPIPKMFPLILGDALQCMRSCLDYLVYELVESGGVPHHKRSQFPIAHTVKEYKDCVKGHMLDGIGADACTIVHALQPLTSNNPTEHPLAILNKLANINKHRRVILTHFASHTVAPGETFAFPNLRTEVHTYSLATAKTINLPMCAYVTIKEEQIQITETMSLVEKIWEHLNTQVFPPFERLFK